MSTPPQQHLSKRKANASPEDKSRGPRGLPALTISSPSGLHSPAPLGRKALQSGPKIVIHEEDASSEVSELSEDQAHQVHKTQIEDDDLISSQETTDFDDAERRSGSSENWFVVPETVRYTLHLICPGHHISHKEGHFKLSDRGSYEDIEKSARKFVEEARLVSDNAKVLNFRHGYCSISKGTDGIKRRISLTSFEEWGKICKSLARDWIDGDRRKFNLTIHREYFELSVRSTDPDETLAAIKRWELNELMATNIDEKRYICRGDLLKYTSDQMVRAIVTHDPCWGLPPRSEESDRLIQDIRQKGARRLLAMCVYGEVGMKCLKKLIDQGFNDRNLPVTALSTVASEVELCCRKHLKRWEYLRESQGIFQVAEFKTLGGHQEISSRTVIPVIPIDAGRYNLAREAASRTSEEDFESPMSGGSSARDRAWIGEGAHGCVYRVRLDPNQHSLSEDRDTEFALKEFKNRHMRPGTNFEKESEMLQRLRRYSNPHLTTHLVTWTQGEKYYMLFPLAQCNLHQYMSRRVFERTKENNIWLLEQFSGLANALHLIHNLTFSNSTLASDPNLSPIAPQDRERKAGWHHDLKPENILYFEDAKLDRKNFQIADFGSSKIHVVRSHSHPTRSTMGTPTYEPPELETERLTSRPYDIWSLGCVFLELLVWAMMDFRAVQKFRDERTRKRTPYELTMDDGFWEKNANGKVALRDSVVQWIERLEDKVAQQPHQPFMEPLKVIVQMLEIDRSKRILAHVISDDMARICFQKRIDLEQGKDASSPGSRGSDSSSVSLLPQRRMSNLSASGVFLDDSSNPFKHTGLVSGAEYFTVSPIDSLSPRTVRPNQRRNSMTSELMPSPAIRSRATSNASGHSPLSPLVPRQEGLIPTSTRPPSSPRPAGNSRPTSSHSASTPVDENE